MKQKIRCIAIDDEPLALELIKEYAAHFPFLELVQTFEDAIGGAEFLRHTHIDLLFVDIQMPDISGLDLVASLKEKPMVIFTTAYRNFAFEGFELEALDYLVKPIAIDRFEKALMKAQQFYDYQHGTKKEQSEALYVYSKYQKVRINLDEIEYIESLKDYCKIYLEENDPVTTLTPLKKLTEELDPTKFVRIHRSYIIPLQKVRSFLKQKVTLTSSIELPVSSKYTNALQEALGK